VGLTSPPRVGAFPDFPLDRSLAKPAVGGDRMWLTPARDEGPREWRIGDNGENSHAETFAPRGAGRAGNCCNERACLLLSYAATTASAATGGTAGSATAATASAARGSSLRWSDRRSERLRRRRQWRRLPLGGRFSNCRRWVSAIIALKSPLPHFVGARVRVRGIATTTGTAASSTLRIPSPPLGERARVRGIVTSVASGGGGDRRCHNGAPPRRHRQEDERRAAAEA
jgi:hypothetical protein